MDYSASPKADASITAAWFGLGVLIAAMVFSLVNLQMIYILAESFKRELDLSDTQVGSLTGVAIGLVTGLATFPMGLLADKIDRRLLLAICVIVWSGATAACGFAQSYLQLFISIMGIAIGEAVLGPITYSIIPDLFPAKRRVLANYIFFASSVIGASIGLALSGAAIAEIDSVRGSLTFIPTATETWRIAIIASATPGPFVIILITLMTLKRKAAARSALGASSVDLMGFFKQHARSLFAVFFGFGLSYSAKSTLFIWAPPALVRVFGEETAAVGVNLGIITAISSIIGIATSGAAYRALHERLGPIAAPRIAQYCLVLGAGATALYATAQNAVQAYVCLFLFGSAATAAMSLSPTVLQEISPSLARGRVVALGGVFSVLFGAATPVLVSAVSDHLPDTGASLLTAIAIVGAPSLVISALILRVGEKTIPGTIKSAAELVT